jgi:ArsR family transcriptional regulator
VPGRPPSPPQRLGALPRSPRLRPGERDRLAATFRALADPSRIEILVWIAGRRMPVCVAEIVERVGLSQPTTSHHLKVLREAGLVRSSRFGTWAFCETEPSATLLLAAAQAALASRPRSRGEVKRP